MMYIENIFICIATPMIVLLLFLEKNRRPTWAFVILGMASCLISAYVSAFIAHLYGAEGVFAVVEVAPVVEETMKILPFVFYVLVFDPDIFEAHNAVVVLAISFATFENICFLADNGASSFSLLVLRGLGTGSMHLAAGALVSFGMMRQRKRDFSPMARFVGVLSVLCVAIVFHGIFNLLLSAGGMAQVVGLSIPIITCLLLFTSNSLLRKL